jgi:hypothetical protein
MRWMFGNVGTSMCEVVQMRVSTSSTRDGGSRATPAGRRPGHDRGRVRIAGVLLMREGGLCRDARIDNEVSAGTC